MMHVFRRDILFLLGFIFLLCILAQLPSCVLAGQGSGKIPRKTYLTPPPRDTRLKSRYPPGAIPKEISGRYPSPPGRRRSQSPPRGPKTPHHSPPGRRPSQSPPRGPKTRLRL
ncbi:serine/arginine repetitive matrix protein 1 isoform X2 [Rhipicephalus sanguineus]|nr:serine/arginine repetitive matrix protein 1 isoform X2 [Rhipicephalus sanguineus]